MRGGFVYPGNNLYYAGERGYYWSSRAYSSTTYAYSLSFADSYVNPSGNGSDRYGGRFLRCLIPTT